MAQRNKMIESTRANSLMFKREVPSGDGSGGKTKRRKKDLVRSGDSHTARAMPAGSETMMDLQNKGFVEVRWDQMETCRQFMLTESVVSLASRIATQNLLSGGMLFTAGDRFLTGSINDAYNTIWSSFLTNCLKSMWLYGFVVVALKTHPNPLIKQQPFVVDLAQARVFVKHHIEHTRDYVVIDTSQCKTDPSAGGMLGGVVMTDIMVFEFEAPDLTGSLTSVVLQCYTKRDTLNHLLQAEKDAVDQNSRPLMVMENVVPTMGNDSTDDAVLNREMTEAGAFKGLGVRFDDLVQRHLQVTDELSHLKANISRAQGTYRSGGLGFVHADMRGDTHVNGKLMLPQNYRLARSVEAKEPSNLLAMLEEYQELVSAMFGVPRSMFVPTSLQRGANPETRYMFSQGQRYLKNLILPLLTTVFRFIHETDVEEEVAVSLGDTKFDDASFVSKMSQSTQMSVQLPGLPDIEHLVQLYEMGALTYTAFVDMVGKIHQIPRHAFHQGAAQVPGHVKLSMSSTSIAGVKSGAAAELEKVKAMYAPKPASSSAPKKPNKKK